MQSPSNTDILPDVATNATACSPAHPELTPAEFWEPWTPAIGQRVRIRLNGECRADWASLPRSTTLSVIEWQGHAEEEGGLTGTVALCHLPGCPLCNDGLLGHRFSVDFDEPVRWREHIWPGGHYAAIELEPLNDWITLP